MGDPEGRLGGMEIFNQSELLVKSVDLTVSATIFAAGEVLADTQEVTNFFRQIDVGAKLHSICVIDPDAQAADDLHLIFLDDNKSLGTENSGATISDADAKAIYGKVSFATADYSTVSGTRIAWLGSLNRLLVPKAGTTSLFIAALNGTGTPTYAGGIITVRLGVELF